MKAIWAKLKEPLWSAFQSFILNFIKTDAAEFLVKNLLKASGFQAWLATILIKYGLDEVVVPVVKAGFVRVEFEADRREGAKFVKRYESAKEQHDREATDRALDDLYSE